MVELLYIRTGHIIRDRNKEIVFTGMRDGHPSINAAKRESRTLQRSCGGLGLGSLRVN